jgi:hypothetical protein
MTGEPQQLPLMERDRPWPAATNLERELPAVEPLSPLVRHGTTVALVKSGTVALRPLSRQRICHRGAMTRATSERWPSGRRRQS